MNTVLVATFAGLATALACWLIFRIILQSRLNALKEKLALYLSLKDQQDAAIWGLQEEKEILMGRGIAAEKENVHLREKLDMQKVELAEMSKRFHEEFKNLAQAILEEKSQKFTEMNQQKMNEILNPFRSQLGEFKQKVEETYDKESKERFTLGREVERLIGMTQVVSQEANNLSTALKGNNKMQGNWGEMILESILDNSGMAKGREYFLQEFLRDSAGNVIKDEHGKGLQPDAMIIYPDGRKVIIDSKVSLVAWDEFCAQDDPDNQKRMLQDHLKSIRQHVDGLSRKNYPRYAGALDYVLMFIPVEPAFLEALKVDHGLWKYAYDKNILLVSPTNLFAVLRIVADLWKVEKQSRNAIEIAEKAGALYDKFAGFLENFELVGKKINEASGIFDAAYKQLSTGRGNLTGRVEELKKMGANASKQLPDRVLMELNG